MLLLCAELRIFGNGVNDIGTNYVVSCIDLQETLSQLSQMEPPFPPATSSGDNNNSGSGSGNSGGSGCAPAANPQAQNGASTT